MSSLIYFLLGEALTGCCFDIRRQPLGPNHHGSLLDRLLKQMLRQFTLFVLRMLVVDLFKLPLLHIVNLSLLLPAMHRFLRCLGVNVGVMMADRILFHTMRPSTWLRLR